MAFVTDNFSGTASTNLTAHTGATGATWTYTALNGGAMLLDGSGGLYGTAAGAQTNALASGIPAAADYSIFFDLDYKSTVASINAYAIGRYVDDTHYVRAGHDNNSQLWNVSCLGGSSSGATVSSAGLTVGVHNCELRFAGTSIKLFVDSVQVISITETSLSAKGRVGVFMQGLQSASNGTHLRNYNAVDAMTPSLNVSPSTASAVTGGATVAITATLVNSSASLTAAVTGGGTISTGTPTSGTPFTYTPPASGTGTSVITVTDATDGISATSTITYSSGNILIYADNAAIHTFGFAPRNGTGAGASAKAVNDGSYIRVAVSGTTSVIARFDGSMNAGGGYPAVAIRADGAGAWTAQALSSGTLSVSLTGLSTARHEIEIMLTGSFSGANAWNDTAPQTGCLFAGLTLDAGASALQPRLNRDITLIYGDSITANQNETFTATTNWPYLLRSLINSEVVTVGWPHQGYALEIYLGAVPTTYFPNTWKNFTASVSRLSNGEFAERPNRIYIAHGENGTVTTTVVSDLITAMRAIYNGKIYVQLGSVNGTNKTQVQAGVTAYLAANSWDTNVHAIDLGTLILTHVSGDRVHISQADAVTVANAVQAAIQAIEGITGSPQLPTFSIF